MTGRERSVELAGGRVTRLTCGNRLQGTGDLSAGSQHRGDDLLPAPLASTIRGRAQGNLQGLTLACVAASNATRQAHIDEI